jgi:hypothetical protein
MKLSLYNQAKLGWTRCIRPRKSFRNASHAKSTRICKLRERSHLLFAAGPSVAERGQERSLCGELLHLTACIDTRRLHLEA